MRQVDRGQSAYLALFDLIARQRHYDERKVRKKLQQQGQEVNLSYAKNYLTRHILKTLRETGEGASVTATVQEIRVLMNRKVYDLAAKMLAKARKKAKAGEHWEAFLHLTEIEITLLAQQKGKPEASIAKIRHINAERKTARQAQLNLGEYEDLYYEYRPVLMRKQRARNEWDLNLIAEFRQHPLMQSEAQALSQRARRMYYRCQILIQAFAGDFNQTFALLDQALGQYREFEFLLGDHPADYINDMLRHGVLLAHFGKFSQVERSMQEIRTMQKRHAVHGSEIFDKYYRLLLGYALATRKYDQVSSELVDIRAGLDRYRESLPWATRCNMLFLLGRVAFEQQDYGLAADWLNQILDETNRGIREDLVSLARILLIFVYYEREEFELVESSSRATRKYLRRREQLYKFEARLLSFLERNSFQATSEAQVAALRALRDDLETIFQDKLEANILAFFNILEWLDGKIAGR